MSSNTTIEGTRVYALPNGSVPCNKPLSDLIHLVKPHIRELVEDSNLVSIAVDGNINIGIITIIQKSSITQFFSYTC